MYWKNYISAVCGAWGLWPTTFWTCEIGHEEIGISAINTRRWSPTSLSVVCQVGFVRARGCCAGSAGRMEKRIVPFAFQNWCAGWDTISVRLYNLGQNTLRGGRVIILPALPGGFNLDNYQVREALCVSPTLSQSHLWPLRWQQSPASAHYSTITFLTAFHISDGWSVCRQAALTRRRKEAPGTHCPDATGPGRASWVCEGNAGKFHKTLRISESSVAAGMCAHSHARTHRHMYTWIAKYTQSDPADV